MINFTGIKEIEFKAKCGGDGECFCWIVDKETYIKIKGWDELNSPFDCLVWDFDKDGEMAIPKSDKYRIYPNDIFGFSDNGTKTISIKWE